MKLKVCELPKMKYYSMHTLIPKTVLCEKLDANTE